METDRELWKLTSAARRAGLEQVFAAHEADGIRAALAAHGGTAGSWLTEFDDFLQVYGWRTEGSCEPVCVVQARPVTVTAAQAAPTDWNPAAMAAKYVFGT